VTKAALSSVFYGKRERVIFLENFPNSKEKKLEKKIFTTKRETHLLHHTQKEE